MRAGDPVHGPPRRERAIGRRIARAQAASRGTWLAVVEIVFGGRSGSPGEAEPLEGKRNRKRSANQKIPTSS